MSKHVLIVGGIAALLAYFSTTREGVKAIGAVTGALSGYGVDGALSVDEVRAIAKNVVAVEFPSLDPKMLVAMAWIESSFRPTAFRLEAHIVDASVGLMQVLTSTAQWLWDIGNRSLGKRPEATDLLDPTIGMYYGAAYLAYLQHYGGSLRDERFMVQAYNVGPAKAATLTGPGPYFEKYLAARKRFG